MSAAVPANVTGDGRRAGFELGPLAREVDDRGADRGERPREADLGEAPLRVDEGRREAAVEPRTSDGLTSSPKSVTRRAAPAPGASVHQRRPGCAEQSGWSQAS